MNVVNRENRSQRINGRPRNGLVRRDIALGNIRGSTGIPRNPYNNLKTICKVKKDGAPRYKFNVQNFSISQKLMRPPCGLPRILKRNYSNSTKPESSSSGQAQPRILASDSAAVDSDVYTPKNRPTALRYISSSSKGGHSTRSARSISTSVAEASVILAISEGRGMARGEIGMAAIDLRHPHLELCQFSDTLLYMHTLTKINYFNPIEVIVPHTFCEGVQPNQLYKLIKDRYPHINVTAVQRRHFNDAVGRQNIQTLCAPQYSAVYLQVLHKFYALTAAAAVLKYVEYIQCIVFARESLKIEYHSSENTMIIDVGTATQLELVQPLIPSAGPSCCLLGVLGPTYTVGGIRALRAAILQPSCNKEFIDARLNAVQELIESDSGLMHDLQDVIKKLSEIDKILFLCIETPNHNMNKYGEAQLNQTLLLKTSMELVPRLVETMKSVESGRLRKIKMDFENQHYKQIADRIRDVIQDDAHLEKGAMGSLQRCFAVKPEINGLLDVARRTYSELIEDIQKIVEQLSEKYDLPIRLNQNVTKGFHIVLPVAPKNRRRFNIEDLPSIFIQVVFNGTNVTMSTEELIVLDHQARESLNEIQKMSNIVISTLLNELRPFMSSLYKLCENIAELDIMLALAQASTIGSYIRPEFDSYLEVRNSVHPLLDSNTQVMPVPNDIFASPEYNYTIITGPNMGGKSIYIKQIAIIQIMAQLGCFLPATNATLRLCDRIFSRIGFNDSVELNASTYVIEMKEMQHILKGVTSSSLVIIDELCRGTSVEEGTSIAWAICERLLITEAFTFFTTHFLYLTRLQDLYNNVVNCHTAVAEEVNCTHGSERKLIYQHKIEPGVTKIENYGLTLAAKTNLPEDTVNLAKELAKLITKTIKPQVLSSPIKTDQTILYELNARIRKETRKYHFDDVMKTILEKFKSDNSQLIERLKNEKSIQNYSTDYAVNTNIIELDYSKQHGRQVANENNFKQLHDSSSLFTHKNDSEKECDDDVMNKSIYTLVRSSSKLLNVMNKDKKSSCQSHYPDEDLNQVHEFRIDSLSSSNKSEILNNLNKNVLIDRCHDLNNVTVPSDSLNIEEDSLIQSSDIVVNTNRTPSNDSDIEVALTQIIGEHSKEYVDSENSGKISTDEELIKETIEEINKELSNTVFADGLVLTPPFEFRDS